MNTQNALLSYCITGVVYDESGAAVCVGESTSNAESMQSKTSYYTNSANFSAWDLVVSITDLDTMEMKRVNLKKSLRGW